MHLNCVFILLLVASACLVQGLGLINTDIEGNNAIWGTKTASTDKLIAREVIYRRKMLLRTVTKTYTLTQAGTAKTINYISVTDLTPKRGAIAEITEGGVGDTSVTLKFTSSRGGEIHSKIEIWGA